MTWRIIRSQCVDVTTSPPQHVSPYCRCTSWRLSAIATRETGRRRRTCRRVRSASGATSSRHGRCRSRTKSDFGNLFNMIVIELGNKMAWLIKVEQRLGHESLLLRPRLCILQECGYFEIRGWKTNLYPPLAESKRCVFMLLPSLFYRGQSPLRFFPK